MSYVFKAAFAKTGIWLVFILALGMTGCCTSSTTSSELRITPLSNKNTITLSADDIVRIMRRAGFSDEQILELGGRMHDSLLHSGAAQLEIGNRVEALFAANNNFVYIATRLRGSFIYDVKNGRLVSSPQS
jgi:hypothetical protein